MKIFNNWRAFLIIGVIISFLLQRYTDFEGWAYIFIAFGFGFIYDFVFNKKKEKMRKLLFAFTILLTLNSCSTFKSGLTIPANQTFLLGEFNDKNYSAELVNKSNLTVIVKTLDKKSGEVTQSFGLAPKGRTKVYISKDETVYFENENRTDVKVDVILSKGVEGMRYIDNK